MRYLIAILFPPLAVLLTRRPITAMVNFVLWLCLILPGVIHALFVVSQDAADERNRELMTAVTGKAIPRKSSSETKILVASVSLFLLTFSGFAIAMQMGLIPDISTPPQTPRAAAAAPAPLPSITGWTMEEVKSKHGAPLATDKATGLAAWPAFTARFESGAVQEVLAP